MIFIWSGKVILGEAKPSPNITLPNQINLILGEFYCVRTGYGVMGSSQFCLKPDEHVNVKWQ